VLISLGIVVPAILSLVGFGMTFALKGTGQLIGLFLMFMSGLLGSFQMGLLRMMTPTALKLFEAKLKKRTLLLIWFEDGTIRPLIGKFESGWIWLRKRLGYLVSSNDDRAFLDGVPTFLAYRGVGKTINPKAMADITLLEKLGISFDEVKEALEKGYTRVEVSSKEVVEC